MEILPLSCFFLIFTLMYVTVHSEYIVDCNTLRLGQYICPDPNVNHIDPKTQQLIGCTKQNKAEGKCLKSHIILIKCVFTQLNNGIDKIIVLF